MKLPPVDWRRADTLADAVEVLAGVGDEARVLAGGQSLMPLMALRMSSPGLLVDITRARDLQGYAVTEEALVVSAAVTARRLETSAEVREAHPLLVAALGWVGHAEIRTRGTVCGAVAHADPAAEVPAVMLALDGRVRVASATRRRRVAAADFFAGPYLTALEPGEMVAGIEVPRLPPTAGWSVAEIARRRGDFALVGVVAVVDLDAAGRCRDVRIGIFGIAATAHRAAAAERALVGREPTAAALAEAAGQAFAGVDVLGDLHGSVTYRRRAGAHLVERALHEAITRTGGAR